MTDTAGFRTDWESTSFSELSTLASCEEKWYRRYVLREPSESGPAANKGTFWHTGSSALWDGKSVEEALALMDEEVSQAYPDGPRTDEEIKSVVDAAWLVERYARHYALQIKQATVVATEARYTRELHYPTRDGWHSVTVKMDVDQLLEIDGKLWLREAKSSGRKDILDLAGVSPQVTLYWWGLAELYPNLYGVLFDFAYTYRWKPTKPTQTELIDAATPEEKASWNEGTDTLAATRRAWAQAKVASHPGIERPDSESFEQVWTDRTPEQVDAGVEWAQHILERRHHLTQFLPGVDRAPTIKNVGPACKFCDHRSSCYESLEFPQQDISLVLD